MPARRRSSCSAAGPTVGGGDRSTGRRRLTSSSPRRRAPTSWSCCCSALNALVANGDAHGKNFSLLHEPAGTLRPAPLYASSARSSTATTASRCTSTTSTGVTRVTSDRLINEAAAWGLPRRRAQAVIASLLDAAPIALEGARDETITVPDEVVAVVQSQLDRLRKSLPTGATASPPVTS
ncbi:MAG: HipA domain-containing protein [Actinomycetota bacterium]